MATKQFFARVQSHDISVIKMQVNKVTCKQSTRDHLILYFLFYSSNNHKVK